MFRCMGCMEEFDDSLNTCPHCGYKRGTPPRDAYDLPPETILNGRYIVGQKLSFDTNFMTLFTFNYHAEFQGYSTPYLGWDCLAKCKVTIREFMPLHFAKRVPGEPAVLTDDTCKEKFASEMRIFCEKMHWLERFQKEDNIEHIENIFAENNTVYVVTQYLNGETLRRLLRREGKIPYQQAINYMLPILVILQKLHANGILHRNITPGSITITNGEPVLSDFKAICPIDSKNIDTCLIVSGYSPLEQCGYKYKQSTSCDIYTCCATLYRTITGIVPEDAQERQVNDMLKPPSKLGINIPRSIENAILNGMNLHPENRVQTAEELIEALRGQIPVQRIYETKSTTRKNRFLHHFFPNRRI